MSYLRVRAADEHYAIDLRFVREVGVLGKVTTVPGSSQPILGVCSVRESILPVIDLAAVFSRPGLGRPSHIAVIEADAQQATLAVDGLESVAEPAGPIEQSKAELLTGTFLADGELVGIVAVDRLLDWLAGARR